MRVARLLVVVVATGCTMELGGVEPSPGGSGGATCFVTAETSDALRIDEAVGTACSTTVVAGLSEQLIEELECLDPGRMGRIDEIPGLSLGSAVFPWLQRPAAQSLAAIMSEAGGTMRLNSGLRTLPQQFLLYRWYQRGRCGIGLAARPGRSNHNGGLAIDIQDHGTWRSRLEARGWRWLGSGDPVHFDYVGDGAAEIRELSVLAFQRLWNRNHPDDTIAEDGQYGSQTETRLSMAPSEGFPTGASCDPTDPPDPDPAPDPDPGPDPDPDPDPEPGPDPVVADMRLTFEVGEDMVWELRVEDAPADAIEVRWQVDGRAIGASWAGWDGAFSLTAGHCADGREHLLEASALNESAVEVGRGSAVLVATP